MEIEGALLKWSPGTQVVPSQIEDETTRQPRSTTLQASLANLLGEVPLQAYTSHYANSEVDLSHLTAGSFAPQVCRVPASAFCGGRVLQGVRTMEALGVEGNRPLRWTRDAVTMVDSKNLSKARTCILAMYADHYADRLVTCATFPWQRHFERCIHFDTVNGGLIVLL